jgi:hypothetical protein
MTPNKQKEVELEPDAWERFERAVDVVAKSPPQHKTKIKQNPPKAARSKKLIPKKP